MQRFLSRSLFCVVVLTGLGTSAAWAQTNLMPDQPIGAGNIPGSRRPPSPEDKPAIPPPDAIPGAKAREPAAPATRGASDMAPNDALFDAINRGDIAGARDALNRGADMNAVNILGMTPMELSVDLGRNDISFLLLSMRGEDSGRGARAVSPAVASAGQTAGRMQADGKSSPARPPAAVAKPIPVATRPVAGPKLFANDGGAPLPNAGFLGFDPRSATN